MKPNANPSPHTVYVAPQANRLLPIVLVSVLLPIVMIASLVVNSLRNKVFDIFFSNRSIVEQVAEKTGLSKVTFPAKCGLNQELELTNVQYEGTGTLIVSDINCKVRIKDSKIKGTVVIAAKNLVEISLENSTIYGIETAIASDMNTTVHVARNSLIKGDAIGLTMGLNGKVTVEDSRIEGQNAAIKSGVNFELSAKNSNITGKEYGLLADNNVKIEFDNSKVNAERAAIRSDANLNLSMRHGSQVKGMDIGVWSTVNSKLELESNSKIEGKRFALKTGHNLELSMLNASLESDEIALCAALNAEIAARDSKLRGGTEAIRCQQKPNVLELVSTTVQGAQKFSGRSCSP
jgi:hypothetical protein